MPKEKELLNNQTTYIDAYGWEKPLTVVDHSPKTRIGFGMTEEEARLNKESLRYYKQRKLDYIFNLDLYLMEMVQPYYPHLIECSNRLNGCAWHENFEEMLLGDDDLLNSLYTHIKNIERQQNASN